ncbi:flagellar filament capping protein FliD [Luteimonas viscosa]|uniref:Flagellar hook-associated protein 2 n=1 Tax=Luteimonas viscosa TaxID=1132694 RepID=A0A5D4XTI5_9GAMM|nr:flagellar filament capping protein FliD [Luteimonas viscosa]TYT26302.1 flagellar filament capping protein FliD [Luteimonas viscosa]
MSTTIGTAGKLDVPTMVAQLVAADRAQPDARIDRSERQVNAQISAIGALRSAFSALGTAVNALTSSDNLQARKAILPPEANFSATTSAGAAAGRYQIEVLALASAQKLTSGAFAADAAVGTGTLTISAGDTSIEVQVAAPDNTLAGIRDAINAAAGGRTVTASIVTGDDGPHLVLNAVDTGTAGALTVTASGGDGGLSALAYDPEGTSGLTELLPAADAKVRIDGIERTSSSNTITDAIDGVGLTLTEAEPGTVRELRIEGDASLQRNAAKSFVSAYNAALGTIAQTTAYNTGTRVAAALNGDSMVRNATRELRDVVGDNVTDLKAIGITINKDGTLKLDEAAFDKGLAADPEAAARVFAGDEGMVGRLDAVVDRLVEADGLLESRSDSLAERSKALANQRSALDFRMSQAEARYRTQFTALDVLLSSLQTSSDFLTQQLARPSTD